MLPIISHIMKEALAKTHITKLKVIMLVISKIILGNKITTKIIGRIKEDNT